MRKIDMNEAVENFISWLKVFPVGDPKAKINGAAYTTAVVSVDFGAPLEPVKLTAEQDQELQTRLKELTSSLTGRRNVRVQYDNRNGIYWTSI